MLRMPSNVGRLMVGRIVWPMLELRASNAKRPTFVLEHVRAVVGILTQLKEAFSTRRHTWKTFDTLLHDSSKVVHNNFVFEGSLFK
jgi:hypothetical protein